MHAPNEGSREGETGRPGLREREALNTDFSRWKLGGAAVVDVQARKFAN